MIGIKLTLEQKNVIHGQFYNEICFFNCVQDINNDWFVFLSESDKLYLADTEFEWLNLLTEFIYVPPVNENPFV